MFGGDDGTETNIFYQWKGAYTKEQMSDEILKVEKFLDANRKQLPHRPRSTRATASRAGAARASRFDDRRDRRDQGADREDPQGAAEVGARQHRHRQPGRRRRRWRQPGQNVQVQLVGDSTETLVELGQRHRADPGQAQGTARRARRHRRPEQRAVGARRSRSRGGVRLQRAARWRSFVGLALRGAPLREFRRGETEVPVWVRFAGAEQFGIEDIASFTVRAPDGRTVPLLAMVDVAVQAVGDADPARQPPDHGGRSRPTSPTRSPCPTRARRWRRR